MKEKKGAFYETPCISNATFAFRS